jgi:hypothetical protein
VEVEPFEAIAPSTGMTKPMLNVSSTVPTVIINSRTTA